jgi:hypothetical protein
VKRPAALIAAAEERLSFVETDFGFERDDHVSGVAASDRHPDIEDTQDIVMAWRLDEEVLKLTRAAVAGEGEAIFLEWFPVVMPMARYTFTGLIEQGTRDVYDCQLARMAGELRPMLETASRMRKVRVAD